jgi:hypothetical protein
MPRQRRRLPIHDSHAAKGPEKSPRDDEGTLLEVSVTLDQETGDGIFLERCFPASVLRSQACCTDAPY